MKHVAALLKVDLTNDQISISHRLIPNHSNPNIDRSKVQKNLPIIVHFANRDKRNEIYSERHLLNSEEEMICDFNRLPHAIAISETKLKEKSTTNVN